MNCRHIFPFISALFYFFHLSFVVFRVEISHSLIKFIPEHFIVFDPIVNRIDFEIFSGFFFINAEKCYWFLYVDFVSCNFTEFIH